VSIALLLEMVADVAGDRRAVTFPDGDLDYAELARRARSAARLLRDGGWERAGLVDTNSTAAPITLFGSAMAGIPYVPLNYRLADDRLRAVLARTAPAAVVVGAGVAERIGPAPGLNLLPRSRYLDAVAWGPAGEDPDVTDPDQIAVLLFTSGTTGEPKAAILRDRHLFSYVTSTVEFLGAGPDEAALVSVPPYHIAAISAVLTNVYAGRRLVVLEAFEAEDWVRTAAGEGITHAMVVPTMLGRILDVLESQHAALPLLRSLSYGGGLMPAAVIERALRLLPHVDFVNAYGLTETSSTIALLTPQDHRDAIASEDPAVRARLRSVGRALPGVELEIVGEDGATLPNGKWGLIWVRGEQVSGEYLDTDPGARDPRGFATNDRGMIDAEGYLFIDGRLDDVIVRGGENISPGEVEDVLRGHPDIADVAVVGVPDQEWGEAVAAVVVPRGDAEPDLAELRQLVRSALRSARVPGRIEIWPSLPYNDLGKLLRRRVRDALAGSGDPTGQLARQP
jgi:acyl-CoA synthetase (AMP-forming)/AMP-acid ligase II